MKKKLFYILIFVGITSVSIAQNTPSPYSIIGIGDIETSSFDRTTGMSNSGIALYNGRFFYQANPASFSYLDDHLFHVEISTRFKAVTYSGVAITANAANQANDLQFKKISAAIKVKPRWAISVGLVPFSTSNYSFISKKTIGGGGVDVNAYYDGSGSINQVYVGNSFRVNKNLSIGIQTGYLFGQLAEKETILTTISDSTLTTTRNIFISNPYVKFGAQFHKRISDKWNLSAGAVGSLKTKLRANYSLLVKDGTSILVDNQEYKNQYFTLPVTYGGGIAATLKNTYTFALDYNYQGWSNQNYTGVGYALVNSTRYSAGFEYSHKSKYRDIYFEKYFLQSGLFYNDSYLKISGQQLNDFGGTIGAGLNTLKGLSLMGALEIGKRGTTSNGLIRENYTQFTLTLSYRDFWYTKVKRYD
jgi:hypothetical protein